MEKAEIGLPMLVWIGVCSLNVIFIPLVIALLRASASKTQWRVIAWSYSLFWSLCCGVCFWLAWNDTPRDYFVISYSALAFLALLFMALLLQLDKHELKRKKRRSF
jgi:dolichyl-phosphate-mannose--protein O-mannosyl transferase